MRPLRILKLYGHKGNTGGIVNLQNGLALHDKRSKFLYSHLRTGRVQSSKFFSQPVVRLFDQFFSYLAYPLLLLIKNPDVIEINSSLVFGAFRRDYVYARLSAFFMPRAKLVLFNHGWDESVYGDLQTNSARKLRKYFSCFDDIVVLTRSIATEVGRFGVECRVHVMTTGVNLEDYSAGPAASTKDAHDIQILFLSRVEEEKGVGDFIAAIPQIVAGYPDVRAIVAGTGSWLEEAKAMARDLCIGDRVTFVGYVRGKEKTELLASSDIFVFPSYREGCPVAVLEALAVGLPLVYTEVGALGELLTNGINGLSIAQKSPGDIASAVTELMERPEKRKQIRENNLQLSRSFDLGEIHRKLEVVYVADD